MTELDLGAALQIAGEQSLGTAGPMRDVGDDFCDARQDASARVVHLPGQRVQVAVEKTPDIRRRGFPKMVLQDGSGDPDVGAAKVIEPREIVLDAELAFERKFQSSFAGAAGVDQSAVDVPKQKCLHGKNFKFTGLVPACEPKLSK